eukprot:jgi/Botrbrau1/13886/Bobra.0056s0117.1
MMDCQGVATYFGFNTQEIVTLNLGRKFCVSARLTVCIPSRGNSENTCVKKYYVRSSKESCAAIAASGRLNLTDLLTRNPGLDCNYLRKNTVICLQRRTDLPDERPSESVEDIVREGWPDQMVVDDDKLHSVNERTRVKLLWADNIFVHFAAIFSVIFGVFFFISVIASIMIPVPMAALPISQEERLAAA